MGTCMYSPFSPATHHTHSDLWVHLVNCKSVLEERHLDVPHPNSKMENLRSKGLWLWSLTAQHPLLRDLGTTPMLGNPWVCASKSFPYFFTEMGRSDVLSVRCLSSSSCWSLCCFWGNPILNVTSGFWVHSNAVQILLMLTDQLMSKSIRPYLFPFWSLQNKTKYFSTWRCYKRNNWP